MFPSRMEFDVLQKYNAIVSFPIKGGIEYLGWILLISREYFIEHRNDPLRCLFKAFPWGVFSAGLLYITQMVSLLLLLDVIHSITPRCQFYHVGDQLGLVDPTFSCMPF